MPELVRNLATMLQMSWEADRARSIGSMVTTALIPVTRPLRAVGLAVVADGILGRDMEKVTFGAVLIAGLTIAGHLLDWASLTLRMRMREHTVMLIDERVIELAAGVATLEHHERPEHQDQMELIRTDRGYLVNPFMPVAWTLATIIQMGATAVVLAGMHPLLLLLPVAGVPSLLATAKAEQRADRLRGEQAEDNRLMLHLLQAATEPAGGKEVRIFDLGDELVDRHRELARRVERGQTRLAVQSSAMLSASWAVFALAFMGSVAFVADKAATAQLGIGAIVLTMSLGAQINSQLAELVGNMSWFTQTAHAVGRYRWLRDYVAANHRSLEPLDPHPVPDMLAAGIDFEGVTFAYPGTDAVVLRDVDLHIPAGAVVAVVGENGAGKTTLTKLLLRFYEPTSGRITVDGVPLADMPVEEWRANTSAGFQDFARFQMLATHGVGVGDVLHFDDVDEVLAALDRAAVRSVVDDFPAGLETMLGREFDERGVDLSLGQWQKLALGRAMMRTAPLLLVLDEPTASLDATTEHALFERYSAAARAAARERGAITLLISHRFSTVRMADLIVVIADGRVAEVGDHDELVALGGLYAELYELQARSYR